MLGNVELVVSDLVSGSGDLRSDRSNVALPHVHGDRLHLGTLLPREAVEEGVESLPAAAVGHMDDGARLLIDHHRDVLMALLVGGLIDTESARQPLLTSAKPASYGSLLDPVDGLPRQAQ